MSRWEQLGSHKVLNFWLKLLSIAIILHLVGLLFFFVRRKERVDFSVSTTQVLLNYPVVVNPLKKTVSKTVAAPKAKAPASKGKPKAPEPKGNTLVVKKPEPQKAVAKKIESKPLPKQEVKQLKQEPAKDLKKEAAKAEQKIVQPDKSKAESAEEIVDSGPIEIGRKDLEEMKLFNTVHNEVAQYFKPPKGMADDIECVIKISLGRQGQINSVDIEKSSNILAFDLSAKKAALQAKLPKEIWGKEIALNFKV